MKKIILLSIICVLLMSGCGAAKNEKNGLAFTTEYTIEDYCHGCLIASKNDGLLYGVLNKDGEEILPIKYDSVSFINSASLLDGRYDNVYIEAQYEGQKIIFNSEGKQILDASAECLNYELESNYIATNDNMAFFVSPHQVEDGLIISFYNEKGNLLYEIDCGEKCDYWDIAYLTPDIILVSKNNYSNLSSDVFLYNKSGNVLEQWNNVICAASYIKNNTYILPMRDASENIFSSSGNVILCSIDETGGIKEENLTNEEYKDQYFASISVGAVGGSNENQLGLNKLYQSNGTWKLVDENGDPLYDERYYFCYQEDDYYFLGNEDNQLCLIDRYGKKIAEYGLFTLEDNEILLKGMPMTDFFAGDDGVCITQEDDVYLFMSDT